MEGHVSGGGGGGGAYKPNKKKKKRFATIHGSVDQNTFLRERVIIKQRLALFSTVISAEGGLYLGAL